MKEIPLTKNKVALIDDEDYSLVSQIKWYVQRGRNTKNPYWLVAHKSRRRGMVLMHRLIMNAPANLEVDHIDHNGLNNQRRNLRLCTHLENMRNSSKRPQGISQYKGVHYHSNLQRKKRWEGRIKFNGEISLGYYKTEIEAAKAYDAAARNLFGRFANLNFGNDIKFDQIMKRK